MPEGLIARVLENADVVLTITGLLGLGFGAGRFLGRGSQVNNLERKVKDLKTKLQQANLTLADTFKQGSQLWMRQKRVPLPDLAARRAKYGMPVVAVGNLKGGVGKTTITTNIAACLADQGSRVLVLDLDWQGSASNVFNNMADIDEVPSDIDALFDPAADGETCLSKVRTGGRIPPRLSYIPTYKKFSETENFVMIEWLAHKLPFDAHYLLLNCLLTKEVKNRFDVIVIDTPPRMTTGLVNALTAATHLLIPTVLDETSGEATAAFLQTASEFKEYNEKLSVTGIVGSITRVGTKLHPIEMGAKKTIQTRAANLGFKGKSIVLDTWIPRRDAIAEAAGRGLAYSSDKEVRDIFRSLVKEMGLGREDEIQKAS